MSEFNYQHIGSCRCGVASLSFNCDTALQDFVARACQCAFCRPSGALYLSAQVGELQVRTRKPYYLYSHRFATNSADFVHCAACNMPLFVRCTIEDRSYAVVNAWTLQHFKPSPDVLEVDYDDEELSERLARRARTWIPQLTIDFNAP